MSCDHPVATMLESYLRNLGASSIILYVKDPFWVNEYRLVCMPGVELTEPMHGFMFPDDARHIISEGEKVEVHRQNLRDTRMYSTMYHKTSTIPVDRRRLFGNFVDREHVHSVIRRHFSDSSGKISAVMFINYSDDRVMPNRIESLTRSIEGEIASHLPSIDSSLRSSGLVLLSQIPEIMNPTRDIAAFGIGENRLTLSEGLKNILRSAMNAFDIDRNEGFGTIHLYNEATETLDLEVTSNPAIKIPKHQIVGQGDGIISWVAHRRRGMLIDDINVSPYELIYHNYGFGSRSEIAVPLLAGTKLLGVLNLESNRVAAFSHESVRPLWYVANEAAILVRVHRQIEETRAIKTNTDNTLDLCHRVATEPTAPKYALNELARILHDAFQLDACEVWSVESPTGRFDIGGFYGTNRKVFCHPRRSGWSRHICKTQQPVFVGDIDGMRKLRVRVWDDSRSRWVKAPNTSGFPMNANRNIRNRSVRCQIGVPILVHQKIMGVAWLKYFQNVPLPGKKWLRRVRGFAGHAGLVIDCLRQAEEAAEKRAEDRVKTTIHRTLFGEDRGSADLPSWLGVEVATEPLGSIIGGDFFACEKFDEGTVGVLLGDAKGHGAEASLLMLPLVAAFRAINRDSYSTIGVIRRLWDLSKKMGIEGTATYVILRKIGSDYWISGSTAGQLSFVVVRNQEDSDPQWFPTKNSPANCGMFGVDAKTPFVEDTIRLYPGDLIVGCTDGILEAGAAKGKAEDEPEMFTKDGLLGTVLRHKARPIGEITKIVMEEARVFDRGKFADDATVVVLKIAP